MVILARGQHNGWTQSSSFYCRAPSVPCDVGLEHQICLVTKADFSHQFVPQTISVSCCWRCCQMDLLMQGYCIICYVHGNAQRFSGMRSDSIWIFLLLSLLGPRRTVPHFPQRRARVDASIIILLYVYSLSRRLLQFSCDCTQIGFIAFSYKSDHIVTQCYSCRLTRLNIYG